MFVSTDQVVAHQYFKFFPNAELCIVDLSPLPKNLLFLTQLVDVALDLYSRRREVSYGRESILAENLFFNDKYSCFSVNINIVND